MRKLVLMDFNPSRVTANLGSDGKVTRVDCA
jgi:hypothetical protein